MSDLDVRSAVGATPFHLGTAGSTVLTAGVGQGIAPIGITNPGIDGSAVVAGRVYTVHRLLVASGTSGTLELTIRDSDGNALAPIMRIVGLNTLDERDLNIQAPRSKGVDVFATVSINSTMTGILWLSWRDEEVP